MARIRAVLFDLDGTLIDNSGQGEAIRATCEELADLLPESDPDTLLRANTEAWFSYWPTVVEAWTLGSLTSEALTTEAWRLTLSRCGCDDPLMVRRAREIHADHARHTLRTYTDAVETLQSLQGRYSLGLVTNAASDRQRAVLRQLGIERYFDAIAISSDLGVAKPDPFIFDSALRQLQLAPEQAWYVGDDPSTDIAGAHAAGITAIWLNRDGRAWEDVCARPHHEISSLSELAGLLALGEQGERAARDG